MEYFFGMFSDNVKDFKIMRGERYLLEEIAEHLNYLHDSLGRAKFNKHFEPPKKYRVSTEDTVHTSVGLFYRKIDEHNQQNTRPNFNSDVMTLDLLRKLKVIFTDNGSLNPVRDINADIIEIIDTGNGYRADVICVLCPGNDSVEKCLLQTFSIQCTTKNSKYYWNTTNFKNHVKGHYSKQLNKATAENSLFAEPLVQNKPQMKCDIQLESTTNEFEINSMPIVDDSSTLELEIVKVDLSNEIEFTSFLFNQFSRQILSIFKAVLTNGEVMVPMVVEIDKVSTKVKVIRTDGNGDCLFAALVLQLNLVKSGTEIHRKMTAELRHKVVTHIKSNFEHYKQALKGSVLFQAEKEGVKYDDSDESCMNFVTDKLSQAGFWGGKETILAVSDMCRVNIIVFDENESCAISNRFNVSYSRSIFIAHRIGAYKNGIPVRNHFDSITEINEGILYKCASLLARKEGKSEVVDLS